MITAVNRESEVSRFTQVVQTPLGEVLLEASATALRELRFLPTQTFASMATLNEEMEHSFGNSILHLAAAELNAYFDKRLQKFSVPLEWKIGTSFQTRVWKAIEQIPLGETVSYSELAVEPGLGKNYSRAVASACGQNPFAIVVPCHRVIGASGALGGYAWGIQVKQQLLDFERE